MSNPIYSYAIVETNRRAAIALRAKMTRHFRDIECVGMYHTSRTALAGLKEHQPDLIFMDVFLENNKTCFEILDSMPPDDHRIVFITESEAHIRQALEYNTVQYVDKPITLIELQECIEKAEEMKFKPKEWPERLRETMYEEDDQKIRINLQDADETIVRVPIGDIFYFKGGGQNNKFSTVALDKNGECGKSALFSKPLKQLDAYHGLPACFYFTRSYIINTARISKILKNEPTIIFGESTKLAFGRNAMRQLKEFLEV